MHLNALSIHFDTNNLVAMVVVVVVVYPPSDKWVKSDKYAKMESDTPYINTGSVLVFRLRRSTIAKDKLLIGLISF